MSVTLYTCDYTIFINMFCISNLFSVNKTLAFGVIFKAIILLGTARYLLFFLFSKRLMITTKHEGKRKDSPKIT